MTHLSTLAGTFRLPNCGRWFMSRERGSNGLVWDFAVIPLAEQERQLPTEADAPDIGRAAPFTSETGNCPCGELRVAIGS